MLTVTSLFVSRNPAVASPSPLERIPGLGGSPGGRFGAVVIAASAGSLDGLHQVFRHLPESFPLPIVIVQYGTSRPVGILERVLERWTTMPVRRVSDGSRLAASVVHIAPADIPVRVEGDGRVRLPGASCTPDRESGEEPLFESAPGAFPGGVIGVVLAGANPDAGERVQPIASTGGILIVQHETAMKGAAPPRPTMVRGAVHYVLPLDAIGPALVSLATHA